VSASSGNPTGHEAVKRIRERGIGADSTTRRGGTRHKIGAMWLAL